MDEEAKREDLSLAGHMSVVFFFYFHRVYCLSDPTVQQAFIKHKDKHTEDLSLAGRRGSPSALFV